MGLTDIIEKLVHRTNFHSEAERDEVLAHLDDLKEARSPEEKAASEAEAKAAEEKARAAEVASLQARLAELTVQPAAPEIPDTIPGPDGRPVTQDPSAGSGIQPGSTSS